MNMRKSYLALPSRSVKAKSAKPVHHKSISEAQPRGKLENMLDEMALADEAAALAGLYWPGTARRERTNRFHRFMDPTTNVRSTISFSMKCGFDASQIRS